MPHREALSYEQEKALAYIIRQAERGEPIKLGVISRNTLFSFLDRGLLNLVVVMPEAQQALDVARRYQELKRDAKSNPAAQSLIEIQREYIDTVNAGMARWSHRKDGGHAARIRRGALHKAEKALQRLGYTPDQIKQVIQDARDVAQLERISVED